MSSRTKGYRIRLSDSKFRKLSELAENEGLTKSQYIRKKVFGMKFCKDCGCLMPDDHEEDSCECCQDDKEDGAEDEE